MGRTHGASEELCLKQTRLMSLVEAIANVVVGYGIAVLTQLIVFPWFGLPARVGDALALGAIFTCVSIARSFAIRRLFEAVRMRTAERRCAANETVACRT
jgi:hypothetical protein